MFWLQMQLKTSNKCYCGILCQKEYNDHLVFFTTYIPTYIQENEKFIKTYLIKENRKKYNSAINVVGT